MKKSAKTILALILTIAMAITLISACGGGLGGGGGLGDGGNAGGNAGGIAGADLELIEKSIMGTLLIIDGEEWLISESSLEAISVESRETTEARDMVTVNVVLKDAALSASGQMYAEFRNNEGWELSEHRVSTPFTTSFLPHAALNMSDADFIAELVKYRITYNEIAARTAQDIMLEQAAVDIVGAVIGIPFLSSLAEGETPTDAVLETMGFSAGEVSDFSVLHTEATNKGTEQALYCSFVLSKGVIDYDVFSEVIYHYDSINGWLLQDVGFTPIIKGVNLEGTRWTGTYDAWTNGNFAPNQLIIEFDEVSGDGAVRATVTAAPPTFKQALVGTVDVASVTVNLIFSEWVSEPSFEGITLSTGLLSFVTEDTALERSHINLNGTLNHLGTVIQSAQGTAFEVSLIAD